MIEDIYEPLERYDREFREAFSQNTSNAFEKLVSLSGIDVAANKSLCSKIHALESDKAGHEHRRSMFMTGIIIAWILCIAGVALAGYLLFGMEADDRPENYQLLVGGGAGIAGIMLFLLFTWLYPAHKEADKNVKELHEKIEEQKRTAWMQMASLNRLYDWDISTNLFEQTVPRVAFDSYFHVGRLRELTNEFGWDDSFNEDKSVLYALSGEINGNPFVFGEFREMEWGKHTYEGTLDISWTERVRDSDGKTHTVVRHETLHAYVTKPKPMYFNVGGVILGNDAAPSLCFSRQPSSLSNASDGMFTKLKKKHEMGKLKKLSQNLDDESQYTLMNNHDFELLFHSTDRTDEVQFRLLFTPLAQRQMLALLKDNKIGYGDEFSIFKQNRITMVFPKHLDEETMNTNPDRFVDWDLERARANFQSVNENFFKSTFFSLAPLLSIPLYQQTRTRRNIYGEPADQRASFWEYEAIANFHGDGKFKEASCITDNILKTRFLNEHDGMAEIAVTAHGFRGIEHTEYVSVHGGDGKYHDVPVRWIEYLPVERTSCMVVSEQQKAITRNDYNQESGKADWRDRLRKYGCPDTENPIFRRDVISFVRG